MTPEVGCPVPGSVIATLGAAWVPSVIKFCPLTAIVALEARVVPRLPPGGLMPLIVGALPENIWSE